MTRPLCPPYVETLTPYSPGKPVEELERELGIGGSVKLASNENAFGPSPKALAAAREALQRINRYPDGMAYYLRSAIARFTGTPFEGVVTGNGSNEIIELIVKAFVGDSDELLTARGTFIIYRLVSQSLGHTIVEVPMKGFRYDLDAMADRISDRTKAVFIANPDNPTGSYVNRRELDAFVDLLPPDVLLVLDEAYLEYATAEDYPNSLDYRERVKRLITVRTFSKAYGLAGLRVGYALTTPELGGYLHRVRAPFNVNLVAQAAAAAALDDDAHVRRAREETAKGRAYLYGELERLGVRFWKSQTNFVLFDSARAGARVYQEMLQRGVILRPMAGYGHPSFMRLTVGTPVENERAVGALEEVLRAVPTTVLDDPGVL